MDPCPLQDEKQIQNPIRQNHLHICALADRLKRSKTYFTSVVVFLNGCELKTLVPAGVFGVMGAINYITSFKVPRLTDDAAEKITKAIKAWDKTVTEEMRDRHVHNLRQNHEVRVRADTSAPTCPRCGAPMVIRNRKSDGKPFYGCSNYPSCRGIVNVK